MADDCMLLEGVVRIYDVTIMMLVVIYMHNSRVIPYVRYDILENACVIMSAKIRKSNGRNVHMRCG